MDTRKSTIPPPSNWNGAGRGEDEVEAREEVEERGVDALHDRSKDDERGCGDDERGERDVGRHEVRLIDRWCTIDRSVGPHFTRENSGSATSCEGVSP